LVLRPDQVRRARHQRLQADGGRAVAGRQEGHGLAGRGGQRQADLADAGLGQALGGPPRRSAVDFVQHIGNGLLQGCMLALVGLGFSMVWGILNIINLTHAAFIMLAAYGTYFAWSGAGVDPFVTLPVTMVALFLLGYLLQ